MCHLRLIVVAWMKLFLFRIRWSIIIERCDSFDTINIWKLFSHAHQTTANFRQSMFLVYIVWISTQVPICTNIFGERKFVSFIVSFPLSCQNTLNGTHLFTRQAHLDYQACLKVSFNQELETQFIFTNLLFFSIEVNSMQFNRFSRVFSSKES